MHIQLAPMCVASVGSNPTTHPTAQTSRLGPKSEYRRISGARKEYALNRLTVGCSPARCAGWFDYCQHHATGPQSIALTLAEIGEHDGDDFSFVWGDVGFGWARERVALSIVRHCLEPPFYFHVLEVMHQEYVAWLDVYHIVNRRRFTETT